MKHINIALAFILLAGCTLKPQRENRQVESNDLSEKIQQIVDSAEFSYSHIDFYQKFKKIPNASERSYSSRISCEHPEDVRDASALNAFVNALQTYLRDFNSPYDYKTSAVHLRCRFVGSDEREYKIALDKFEAIVRSAAAFPSQLCGKLQAGVNEGVVKALESTDKFKVIKIDYYSDTGVQLASQVTVVQPLRGADSVLQGAKITVEELLKGPPAVHKQLEKERAAD